MIGKQLQNFEEYLSENFYIWAGKQDKAFIQIGELNFSEDIDLKPRKNVVFIDTDFVINSGYDFKDISLYLNEIFNHFCKKYNHTLIYTRKNNNFGLIFNTHYGISYNLLPDTLRDSLELDFETTSDKYVYTCKNIR